MTLYVLISIILSLIIAFFGRDRKFGFWGYFFGSMLLTPLIGVLLLLAGGDKSAAKPSE